MADDGDAEGKGEVDRSVTAVERTLAILDALLTERQPLRLKDIERVTGLFHSVILRYMISLERSHYIHKRPDGSYVPGPKLFQLGKRYEEVFDLEAIVQPVLGRLVDALGETASFYIRDNNQRVCLYRHHPEQPVRVAVRQGSALPLDETSTGQALQLLDKRGSIASLSQSERVCTSSNVRDLWSSSMSTPVLDAKGALAGALTISGPTNRFDVSNKATQLLLISQAQLLSQLLGYREPSSH